MGKISVLHLVSFQNVSPMPVLLFPEDLFGRCGCYAPADPIFFRIRIGIGRSRAGKDADKTGLSDGTAPFTTSHDATGNGCNGAGAA